MRVRLKRLSANAGGFVDTLSCHPRFLHGNVLPQSPSIDHSRTAPRIALAHDWLVGLRGGEWVLDRLARLFGPTDLYTLVNDGRPLTPAIDACRVVTSPLQRFPGAAGRLRRHYLPLMPWAVSRLRVPPGSCELLISTSSAVMKSIIPPANVPHLCYCHSPARYIWEQGDDYSRGSGGGVRSLGLRLVRGGFQRWDRHTADRVTQFIANSQHTAARIKRCYDRDAIVIYPPVRTEFFTIDPEVQREEWFLVAGALEPYKRVDLVIETALRLGLKLKVAGEGSQRDRLAGLIGANRDIELLGRVSDESLRDLYRRAKALVFPQVEDFGIIAVEAQACGCPVIAFNAGGAKETVSAEESGGGGGLLFEVQTIESLVEAMTAVKSKPCDPVAIRRNALRFSEANFDQAILAHVNRLLGGAVAVPFGAVVGDVVH